MPDTDILVLGLYPALVLNPEHGFNVPSKLVFCYDMIEIDVKCICGKAPVVIFFRSMVENCFRNATWKESVILLLSLYVENS